MQQTRTRAAATNMATMMISGLSFFPHELETFQTYEKLSKNSTFLTIWNSPSDFGYHQITQ
jgi:hypothetical protein